MIHSSVVLRITGLVLLLLWTWACNRESSRTLTVAINAGVEGSALRAAAEEWGAAHKVNAEIVELPYGSLFEKELLDLSGHSGAYDVIMMDDPWFPRLAENRQLKPLTITPDEDFLPSCVAVCRYPPGETLYALPFVGNSQLFFYRKDLFEKHKLPPPKTWHEVLIAAKKLNAAEGMFGYVMRAAPGNSAVTDFMPLLWAFDADLLDASGKPVLSSPQGIEALKFMIELGRYSPPGYAGFNADEVSAHLLQNTAAMSINWPAWIASMDDPQRSKVVGKIEFTQMPSARRPGQAELGSWLLGIPAASKNSDLAMEFLSWVTSPSQMKKAAERGNPPTRRSVFLDPELRKKYRSYPAQLASLETARPRPRTGRWNEVENALGIFVSQANSGTLTPEQAMTSADKEIRAIVDRKP